MTHKTEFTTADFVIINVVKTSKFDWTPKKDFKRFQNFLNSMGLILEFNSRSLNYSMPKEGSCGVIGKRNSI